MAMIGIGLGGLAQGFERGVGLGDKMHKMNRERENEGRVDAARTAGEADFNAAVERGDAQPEDIAASIRFAAPHMMRAALQNNDPAMLKQFYDFSRSEEANAGAKLFESGMRRVNLGDVEGGWQDFQKLGKLKGYGGEYEIGPLGRTEDGKFTTTVKTADGRTLTPTFASPQEFMAAYGNPAVAFEDSRRRVQRQEANADDATRYGARKSIDLRHQQEQQAAGLGPVAYDPYNFETTGEDGKAVTKPYRFNRRSGEYEAAPGIEGNGRLTRPTGAGGAAGGGNSVYRQKRNDWLAVHPDDEQGALDFAAGRRQLSGAEMVRSARAQAIQEINGNTQLRFSKEADRNAAINRRAEENLQRMREANGQRGGTTPPASEPPSGGPSVPASRPAPGGAQNPPAPRNAADRKVGQTYTAPDGRNVQWTGKGWMVVE